MLKNIPGMTPARMNQMSYQERIWWIDRIAKQFKMEKEAIEGSNR